MSVTSTFGPGVGSMISPPSPPPLTPSASLVLMLATLPVTPAVLFAVTSKVSTFPTSLASSRYCSSVST
ncbi:hypothetical protein D3C80_1916170 [compost metagenome]